MNVFQLLFRELTNRLSPQAEKLSSEKEKTPKERSGPESVATESVRHFLRIRPFSDGELVVRVESGVLSEKTLRLLTGQLCLSSLKFSPEVKKCSQMLRASVSGGKECAVERLMEGMKALWL